MAEPIFEALRELCEAITAAGRGGGTTELTLRVIRATNEAHRLLVRQQAETTPSAEPPAPAPAADGEREVLARLLDGDAKHLVEVALARECHKTWELARRVDRAAALLRECQPAPAPAPAADGEREELAALIEQTADSHNGLWPGPIIGKLFRAAALLRQPAPAPVPVSERPWERPGWCDTEGRCWIGTPETEYPLGDTGDYDLIDASWSLELPPSDPALHRMQRVVSHPHWAIPQPPQGEEVTP